MPRILIPILALACLLLVGGCTQKIDRDELRSALKDLHEENLNDPLPTWDDVSADSDTNIIPQPHQPNPCPPCPDTVKVFLEPDSILYRLEVKGPVDTPYRMPPGTWVKIHYSLRDSNMVIWWDSSRPDSVFILKGE